MKKNSERLAWFDGSNCETLKRLATACSIAACMSASAGAQTVPADVPAAYVRLIAVLRDSSETTPNPAQTLRITDAARNLQNVIKLDGGARPSLLNDATNIQRSLEDRTFSARGSVAALQRDAAKNAVLRVDWRPALAGQHALGAIGTHLNQTSEGDCVGISVVRAFANTAVGADILHKAVTRNVDGSFNVSLPGDSTTQHRVGPTETDQYGKGDASAAAVVGALFQYFQLDPKRSSLPTNKVMEVLAGSAGEHARLADSDSTPAQIMEFLKINAPLIGKNVAMVFGGAPTHRGDWSKGDGHAFAVININSRAGTLIYTNPWDEGKQHTIALSELAGQAAGTSADFETVTFR
jgi:hypothetical protein